MAAVTYGHTTPAANAAVPATAGRKRKNIFRLLLEAFIEARQLQAEMEIKRHLGYRLTNEPGEAAVSYKGRE